MAIYNHPSPIGPITHTQQGTSPDRFQQHPNTSISYSSGPIPHHIQQRISQTRYQPYPNSSPSYSSAIGPIRGCPIPPHTQQGTNPTRRYQPDPNTSISNSSEPQHINISHYVTLIKTMCAESAQANSSHKFHILTAIWYLLCTLNNHHHMTILVNCCNDLVHLFNILNRDQSSFSDMSPSEITNYLRIYSLVKVGEGQLILRTPLSNLPDNVIPILNDKKELFQLEELIGIYANLKFLKQDYSFTVTKILKLCQNQNNLLRLKSTGFLSLVDFFITEDLTRIPIFRQFTGTIVNNLSRLSAIQRELYIRYKKWTIPEEVSADLMRVIIKNFDSENLLDVIKWSYTGHNNFWVNSAIFYSDFIQKKDKENRDTKEVLTQYIKLLSTNNFSWNLDFLQIVLSYFADENLLSTFSIYTILELILICKTFNLAHRPLFQAIANSINENYSKISDNTITGNYSRISHDRIVSRYWQSCFKVFKHFDFQDLLNPNIPNSHSSGRPVSEADETAAAQTLASFSEQ